MSSRVEERAKPWTPAIEEVYKQYVLNIRAEKLIESLGVPLDDEESGNGDVDDDICEDAIRIVNLVDDYEILNNDVHPENFLVKAESWEGIPD